MLADKVDMICRQYKHSPAALLSNDPEIRPTPLEALAIDELPTELHFVRNHFGVPALDPETWTLQLAGAVRNEQSYSLSQLRDRPSRTETVVLECAGHRRSEYQPNTSGLQWGIGALSEARWTGVSLSDLLREASPSGRACEVAFEGADRGPHRSTSDDVTFARSIPLERAFGGDVLVAWEMNGHPLPAKHGGPLRLVVPGSYAVASVKWLRRITVLEQPFAGPFQTNDYQVNGEALDELKVNSLIVNPCDASTLPPGSTEVSGVAWGGRGGISSVEVRCAGGPWQQAVVEVPLQTTALHRWSIRLALPSGEHRLEVRARDRFGTHQPERAVWNELGYANNGIHGILIRTDEAWLVGAEPGRKPGNSIGG
jgi:DMSO/TMAO reductase YedYZ molybdopterin-dependent catalytic subunit